MNYKTVITGAVFTLATTVVFALPQGKTTVKDSTLYNKTTGNYTAIGKSNINAGITAKNANIDNSTIYNKTVGKVKAYNRSNVNTGVNVNNARVHNSNLAANTKAHVSANRSNVDTGINVSGARNSNISTNVNANINARNSNVNVGSVKGNVRNKTINTNVSAGVNARNKNVNIGNVVVQGGRVNKFDKYGKISSPRSSTNVGSVVVNSDRVKEVNTTVGGGGSISNKIKTRHKAKFYADKGGVDPSGSKHVYVTKRQRKAAERASGDAGSTYVKRGSRVRKVNTYVE